MNRLGGGRTAPSAACRVVTGVTRLGCYWCQRRTPRPSPTCQGSLTSRFQITSSRIEDDDFALGPGRWTIDPTKVARLERRKQREKNKPRAQVPFKDRVKIKTRGGSGGKGSISFHSLGSYKKRPCGGHGGKGGDVYLITDSQLSSLKLERHHYFGQDGGNGGKNGRNGRNGNDLHVRVPCGVVVRRVLDWDELDVMYGDNLDDNDGQFEGLESEAEDDERSEGEDEQDESFDSFDPAQSEQDFEEYYEALQSSKKHRKQSSEVEIDKELVNSGVRADDGMYHWSSSDLEMASTAYGLDDGDESRMSRHAVFVADLDQPNTRVLVAGGGKGGVGNQAYASRHYFSGMAANAAKKAAPGPGELSYLELELKLIADAGLVGFPNAGKSSLLSAMSRATPKIASYPFTTLHPLVGTVQYNDGFNVVMADVPGLIDGAAEGRGKGMEFLRHIERTKALVYIVDAAGVDGRCPVNDLRILGKELSEYGSSGVFHPEDETEAERNSGDDEIRRRRIEIMNRPSLILANKMDLIPKEDTVVGRREEILYQLSQAADEVGIACASDDILGISAGVSGEGLQILSKKLRSAVEGAK